MKKDNQYRTRCQRLFSIGGRGMFQQLAMLLLVLMSVMPTKAWAGGVDLLTTMIEGKTFYVLRSSDDWDKFRQLVIEANGESDVNAIMDADFTAIYSIGFRFDIPYRGTFDGNGHTLNVNINSLGSNNIAPFSRVDVLQKPQSDHEDSHDYSVGRTSSQAAGSNR